MSTRELAGPAPRATDPERRSLPVDAWPEPDRAAWQAARRGGGFLEPSGGAADWAPATRQLVEKTYGHFLTWLARTGQLDPAEAPGDRLGRHRVAAFAEHLLGVNAAQTVIGRLVALRLFARTCAPGLDTSFIARLTSRLQPRVVDSLGKPLRLRHTVDLVGLGLELIARSRADGGARRSRRQAVRYRDGFMIALLALRPLRLRNFAALALDRHLVRRGGAWWIVVAADETKTRRPIEVPFPGQLVGVLETHLAEIRPALRDGRRAGPDGGRLWLSERGRPLPARTVYTRITRRTAQAFGRSVNPHLFRDAAATTVALEDPGHARVAAQLLGHSTFATTERFYRMSRMAEAVRAHGDLLEALYRPERKRRGR